VKYVVVDNDTIGNELRLDRQRRVRRTTWWLAALALSFYVGFIIMSVRAAHG
jgi:hypothetical protein